MPFDINTVRAQFPALKSGYIFAENAGGSQCLKTVADAVYDYLLNANVQLGATYSVSVESTTRVDAGPIAAAKLVNAASPHEIVFGASSTILVANLSRAMENDCHAGEEIVISGIEHESNAGPWKRLALQKGMIVKSWAPSLLPNAGNNQYAVTLALRDLLPLITARTRLVAFTACSNVLGEVVDVSQVVAAVRAAAKAAGARKVEVCIDCVAYAPHRRIDVQAWDVDYCYFSYYKVFGPHTSVLYVRKASLDFSLTSLAHFFLTAQHYKLAVGGTGYELTYASSVVLPYLLSLGDGSLDSAFAAIAAHEAALEQPLLALLTSDASVSRGVRVLGRGDAGTGRVPTISFIVTGPRALSSVDIVTAFDKTGDIGIRNGHFYAFPLIKNLGIDTDDAVVRISLVHTNTVQEVERIVAVLKEVLA